MANAMSEMVSACFVVSAVFGADSEQVRILRMFRDQTLREYALGEKFVRWYYRNGPLLARATVSAPTLQRTVRIGLSGLVKLLARHYPLALGQAGISSTSHQP